MLRFGREDYALRQKNAGFGFVLLGIWGYLLSFKERKRVLERGINGEEGGYVGYGYGKRHVLMEWAGGTWLSESGLAVCIL